MRNFSVVTLNKKNITDFALERNKLLRRAKTRWVFFVDSDEAVSPELLREIENKIKSTKQAGFYVYRKNYFLGRYIGTDKILRIVKKGSGKWKRAVHEEFIFNESYFHLAGGNVMREVLIHNTATSLYDYLAKINKYAAIHSSANKKEGKKSNLFKIVFYPKMQFIKSILKGRGLVFSILQAFHSFLAWSELWILQKN